jgi:hypothetical protein
LIEGIDSFGDKVVCHYTASVAQEGKILNLMSAYKVFTLQGIDIFRFVGREIVEHWGIFNLLPLVQQMENECHQLALNGYPEISG